MKKALFKETLRSIKRSKARYISIIAIVALGISFFAGIKATAPDMKDTAAEYFKNNNLMDIQVISPIGLDEEDIAAIEEIDGVDRVMASRFVDGILKSDGRSVGDFDGSEMTCRAFAMDFEEAKSFQKTGKASENYMNRLTLLEGQWPDSPNECVVDNSKFAASEQMAIGKKISLAGDGTDLSNKLKVTEFEIVGIIRTPRYVSFEHGNTNIGSGKLSTSIFIPEENFLFDYYTEACIKVSGADKYTPFTQEYNDVIAPVLERFEAVEDERLPIRAEALKAENLPKVQNGREELEQKQREFDLKIAEGEEKLNQLKTFAEQGESLVSDLKEKFNSSLSAAQRELLDNTSDYNSQYKIWREKKDQLNKAKIELAYLEAAKGEFEEAKRKLETAQATIKSSEESIAALEEMIISAQNSLDRLYEASRDNDVERAIEEVRATLETYQSQLAMNKQKLETAKAEYAENKKKYDEVAVKMKDYDKTVAQVKMAEIELEEAERSLTSGNSDIKLGQLQLTISQYQLQNQIQAAESRLATATETYEQAKVKFDTEKQNAQRQLDKAKSDLTEAENLLESLDTAEWMVMDRDAQPGYEGYGQTADRMNAFAQVFPVFFFLVAAMVCLTTMTRMVEEERTQLGTLKALGYSGFSIISKYMIYSLSASLIGSVIGLALGFVIFPKSIFAAYDIMYEFPPCVIKFKWTYAIIGTFIALMSTGAAAFFACRRELREKPATLMRPKAPKVGKRILLEKITPIWSRMNFTSKVTARNLFRNKKRFITTLIGVAGCTSLLLTGFGLGDSISAIMDKQFGDSGVCKYDVQIVLKEGHSFDSGEPEIMKTVKGSSEISSSLMTRLEIIEGTSESAATDFEINLLVPQNTEKFGEFITLENRKSGDAITLDDSGVVISEEFADQTNTKVGDNIILTVEDKEYTVPVAGITENYTFHYVYMSPALYEKTFGTEPMYNHILASLVDDISVSQKDSLATELMKENGVSAVAYTTQLMDTFKNIIESLNLVVAIFVISAAALAFVVLYNLANINLNERIREVSTLKVLGFRDKETSTYLVRENIILTILGTAIGLFFGIFLHRYVVSIAEVDVVMFGRTIEPLSYVLSAVFSLVFSAAVNFIMHIKLKKVNMVESLKAIE